MTDVADALVAVYALFAVAAGARALVQVALAPSTAPAPQPCRRSPR